ncbi:progranulin-like [Paramacrobiotus metropolitanus]|uniref:progranulin-like n=1 Tax=Paramacrobiotus metropolitanus TaxID=2943436 RepID=UPI0024457DB9|nr:progranulin-like [Paramacrobiotus metropolitanus]
MKVAVAILLLGLIVCGQASRRVHPLRRIASSVPKLAVGDDCPAGTCSDSETCCQTDQGWGCCPYQNAVCCSDKQHCCPNGTTCDLVHQQCTSKRPHHTAEN